MIVTVFLEAEAGSRDKGLYDESTLVRKGTRRALVPYPYPYGFVLGTPGGDDGECLDCFVITHRRLFAGREYRVQPIGILEMTENGEQDWKLLARLPDEEVPSASPGPAVDALREDLAAFINKIFTAYPDVRIETGAILPAAKAEAIIAVRLTKAEY
jgi:inorganic pyrophosphatase